MVVDFPAPLGPKKPNIWPVATLKESCFTTDWLPKFFESLLMVIPTIVGVEKILK